MKCDVSVVNFFQLMKPTKKCKHETTLPRFISDVSVTLSFTPDTEWNFVVSEYTVCLNKEVCHQIQQNVSFAHF